MATLTKKGWVPKGESGNETMNYLLDHKVSPYKTRAIARRQVGFSLKQVELTIICKDVVKEKT